jgi:DNA-binding HxlR family transcriptional regulator
MTEAAEYIQRPEECNGAIVAIKDSLYVLSGKWKIPLIVALKHGAKRFKDIQRYLDGITPKILSKELKELELNGFITRTVFNTIPVTVTYELTPYAASLDDIINELRLWGVSHRKHIVEMRKAE